MSLNDGDFIIITGYDTDDFYQDQFYKHLLYKPTRVWDLGTRGTYLSHPYLDMVPFSDKITYEKIDDSKDFPSHGDLKSLTIDLDNIMGREGREVLKNLRVKKLKKRKLKETIIKVLREEDSKSKTDEKLLKLVSRLENDEITLEELSSMFGSLDNFIGILSKRNLMSSINPFSEWAKDIQNSLLYAYVQNDPDFVYEIALKYMNGITKVGEDYYYDADYSELADLFKTGRDISEKTIESILSGEYDPYEYGGYDTEDEYEDVYNNLDHYAKSVVNEYIVNELKVMETLKFQYSNYRRRLPDLFSTIAEEQGTEEEFKLTDEVISRLMTDKESLKFLITREFDDVRSNLSSIYSTCYGDVLSSEWYNDMWSELVGEIVDSKDGEDYSYEKSVWLKDGTRGKKTAYGRKYKVTNCLKNIIKGWLEFNKNKNGYNNNTIEYFGSYTGLIKDAMEYGPMDWLDVPRLDDYPDHRQLYKCMSENVESYF